MGSSSQLYRDTSTEDWDNATTAATGRFGGDWMRGSATQAPADWTQAASELRWVWELHVYGMAGLFSVLCVLCLFTVLRLRAQLSARPHLSPLNVFLGILAASRLVVLFVDPYGSKQTLPTVMLQVLWDLGYPCLVSAFALLQLSFVRTTQLRTNRLSDESTVSIIITFHFCLIITSGVLGAVQHSLRILWLITQAAFIIWGGFLCISSLLGCLRLLRMSSAKVHRFQLGDPGYEIHSIGDGGFRQLQQPHRPKKQHQPKIHITDVNEQTYSYASQSPVSVNAAQLGAQRLESFPLRCLSTASSSLWESSATKGKSTSPNEDPAMARPLMGIHSLSEAESGRPVLVPSISSMHVPPRKALSPKQVEEFKFDARELKRQSVSSVERQLRYLVATSGLGVALCLLKAYDVFGPRASLLPWFCLQSVSRIVEFSMAYAMVCESQQSLTTRYYYFPN